ncbi:MAG TPA: zinc-ribbon domain-containing protein [Candidatus Saccharicenans sp.]|nr:zinc-ribbon domain-containing protein [Candidatus Saccharicenans sp.]HQO76736.1 zinc-ribbon domain-containing protein [Candidatus Saccharicenans sp.]
MQEEKKKCPFCGEEILKVAIKCKYCGSILDGSDQEKKITISGVDLR